MKRRTILVAALIVLASGLTAANAATIVNDTFETYTSQANFEATWIPIGTVAPLSGEWSTEQSTSPTHSIKNPSTAVSNQSRNRLTFAATPTITPGSKLVWSYDYWDNLPGGNPQRNYANLQSSAAPAASPAGQLISMGLNNNQLNADSGGPAYMARILGYAHPAIDAQGGPGESGGGTGSGAYFKMNDIATGGRGAAAGWRNLKVEISVSGANTKYDFFVNNVLAETELVPGAPLTYTEIRMGSGLSNGSVPVYFDNMFLAFIPANTPPTVVDAVIGPPYNANEPGEPQTLTHQFTATDTETPAGPFTWDQLQLLSYTPNYGGVAPGPAVAATLSGSGLFSWVSEGSPRGDYVWQVRGTDPGGASDTGTITVHVTEVPEPTTLALCGLALIGSLSLIRRREG